MINKLALTLWAIALFLPAASFSSTKAHYLKITARADFRDSTGYCDTDFFLGDGYLEAVEKDGLLVRVALRSWKFQSTPVADYVLPAAQLKHILFYRHSDRSLWLKEISLSPQMVGWMLRELGRSFEGDCRTDFHIATLVPGLVKTKFELDGLPDGIFLSYSDMMKMKGTRTDRTTFQLDLQLAQTLASFSNPLLDGAFKKK